MDARRQALFDTICEKYSDEDIAQFKKFVDMIIDMDRLYMGGFHHMMFKSVEYGLDMFMQMKKEQGGN